MGFCLGFIATTHLTLPMLQSKALHFCCAGTPAQMPQVRSSKTTFFFFGSLERIRESRELNFLFPANIPGFLQAREETFDRHSQTFETRSFLKFDEQLGRHHVTQQMNLINGHVTDFLPLSQATNLPSTRTNSDSRFLMVGFHDVATLGNLTNPWLLNAYFQYRRGVWPESGAC